MLWLVCRPAHALTLSNSVSKLQMGPPTCTGRLLPKRKVYSTILFILKCYLLLSVDIQLLLTLATRLVPPVSFVLHNAGTVGVSAARTHDLGDRALVRGGGI